MHKLSAACLIIVQVIFFKPFACGSGPDITELPSFSEIVDATGYKGGILIYEVKKNEYLSGHVELIDERYIPASTFKIFSALVALETGVIEDKNAIINWDGVVRGRDEINRDLDLQSAFRLSAVPHFQELVRRVGAERMQHYVDTAGYGNRDISGGIDQFWLRGGLKISLREQVAFVTRLYHDDLPFSPAVIAAVKEMMVVEETPDYVIRAKTGWGVPDNDENVGWWVGWIAQKTNVYIFATVLNTTDPDEAFGPARQLVTKQVFEQMGVLNTRDGRP